MRKSVSIVSLLIMLSFSAFAYASGEKDDIRIVIDVSGSMKKTDPSNLRVSALKLLNGLIPNDSKAGIWTFGKYVNQTVKWGTVDNTWRKLADRGADEIHSNALFTNIESALERSTKGWEKIDPETRRSLVLLTDGQVDISKNSEKNALSRQAILDKSLPRLREAGAHIYAIALSRDADETLLKQIALETEGSFEIAESAQDLQKIFFKMFERAVQPDTVELKDNQFTIDSKIEEMTLLVFRKPGGRRTHLFPPGGKAISARRPGKSSWRSDEGYDLITIKKPEKGVWSIEADIDPDNRVMVVTDLKLEVSGLPSYITPLQAIDLSAALFNQGNQIKKNSFLRFVDFELSYTKPDGSILNEPLKHAKDRKQKGQYKYRLDKGLEEGKHSILVQASSRTFNRSKRVDLTVQWPAVVSIKPAAEPGHYLLSVSAREEYLVAESLQTTVKLEAPDQSTEELKLVNNEGVWQTELSTSQDGIHRAWIKIEAKNQAGEMAKYDLGAFTLIGVYRQPEITEVEPVETASVKDGSNQINANGETETQERNDNEPDWLVISIAIGAANLVLVLVAVGVMLVMRRKSIPEEFSLE